jgi:hypothetical protein
MSDKKTSDVLWCDVVRFCTRKEMRFLCARGWRCAGRRGRLFVVVG